MSYACVTQAVVVPNDAPNLASKRSVFGAVIYQALLSGYGVAADHSEPRSVVSFEEVLDRGLDHYQATGVLKKEDFLVLAHTLPNSSIFTSTTSRATHRYGLVNTDAFALSDNGSGVFWNALHLLNHFSAGEQGFLAAIDQRELPNHVEEAQHLTNGGLIARIEILDTPRGLTLNEVQTQVGVPAEEVPGRVEAMGWKPDSPVFYSGLESSPSRWRSANPQLKAAATPLAVLQQDTSPGPNSPMAAVHLDGGLLTVASLTFHSPVPIHQLGGEA